MAYESNNAVVTRTTTFDHGVAPTLPLAGATGENGYQKKTRTIPGVKFLERFLDHIVPPYFRRIRHLGFLSSRSKKQSLAAIRESLGEKLAPAEPLSRAQVLALCFGERSLLRCRDCGGELQLMETYPKDRAPPFNVMAGIC